MTVVRRGIFLDFTVDTPDGEKTYSVPAAGIDAGMTLAKVFTASPAVRARTKLNSREFIQLAIGDVWDQLAADGVPYTEAFRLGMACLAREQILLSDTGPTRWEVAERAARGVWEAGIDPEALAAWAAANSGGTVSTNRATRRAAAGSTRKPKPGTGSTKTPSTSRSKATRSRGSRSGRTGR